MANLIRVAIAAVIAFTALYFYDQSRIDPERFGVDTSVQLPQESQNGRFYTASSVKRIGGMIADYRAHPIRAEGGCNPFTILWLGNSQLHIVNQAKPGDHTSPYWLRHTLDCPRTTVPLGVSLANANLQEHYLLTEYATARVPVDLVILAVCFDKLRDDGLRPEFSGIIDGRDRANLSKDAIGREMLRVSEKDWKQNESWDENAGLNGFAQKYLEDRLVAGLAELSPLWADRSNLRTLALVDLYHLRNAVLGIKGTTVRKAIPVRWQRNMRAMEALLKHAQENNIRVVVYVQPIRQDVPMPYDPVEYAAWKQELAQLVPRYGATLLNFESLVPGEDWGIFDVTVDVDFMHFRNQGHKLLAAALAPYVRAAQKEVR